MIMDRFTEEERVEILEIARLGLGMVFNEIADEMDLSDDYLTELREKMYEAATEE